MAGGERKKTWKGVRRCYGRDRERTAALLWDWRDGEQVVALLWERRGANGGAAMGVGRGHLATWGLRLLNVLLEG
jgi:hypothetical protein